MKITRSRSRTRPAQPAKRRKLPPEGSSQKSKTARFPHCIPLPPDRGRPIYTTPSSPPVFSLPQHLNPTTLLPPPRRPSLAGRSSPEVITSRALASLGFAASGGVFFFGGGIGVFPPGFPGLLGGVAARAFGCFDDRVGGRRGSALHRRSAIFPQFFSEGFWPTIWRAAGRPWWV
jgi:hypothetical protein